LTTGSESLVEYLAGNGITLVFEGFVEESETILLLSIGNTFKILHFS